MANAGIEMCEADHPPEVRASTLLKTLPRPGRQGEEKHCSEQNSESRVPAQLGMASKSRVASRRW